MLLKLYKKALPSHITQKFSPQHRAIDLAFGYGTFLVAPEDCFVYSILMGEKWEDKPGELDRGYGIVLRHLTELEIDYSYWHCLPVFPVKVGEKVKRGQIVAQMGNSGLVKTFVNGEWKIVPLEERTKPPYPGTHTHFVVRKEFFPVDPVPLIDWNTPVNYSFLDVIRASRNIFEAMINLIKNLR